MENASQRPLITEGTADKRSITGIITMVIDNQTQLASISVIALESRPSHNVDRNHRHPSLTLIAGTVMHVALHLV